MGQKKDTERLISALERNWRAEMEGAATYRELAELETNMRRREVLVRLAQVEERHAAAWAERIAALGGKPPSSKESHIAPHLEAILTARVTGLDAALRRVEAEEEKHVKVYESQVSTLGDEDSARIARELAQDEAGHARTLRTVSGPLPDPKTRLQSILHREKWHVSTGSWIGDAIYGVNDGLTAVFGIVAGVAAYGTGQIVVVAGIAGMLASALSMGASGFLASKSEREVFEAELSREKREVEEKPDEEKEELALFYQLKGLPEEQARELAERLYQRPDEFLRTLAQEELGVSRESLPDPVRSAFSAIVSTAAGAAIPVLPFLFMVGTPALIASATISLLGHFAVGAAKSLVTLRRWWVSGLEMTAVAVVVAVVTYLVGSLFAVR